ncbi:MAG: substrate-binding domain-containing protein [Caldilineaceae bacterium]
MARFLRSHFPTIGVLAGWQYYWTATPRSYLDPIFRGIRAATQRFNSNLLLGCGMGTAGRSDVFVRPAWPARTDNADFVPIGPWNTDGLIVINPLHAESRSTYVQQLRAEGYPLIFVGSGESGPTIVADNEQGIDSALRHLVDHGHRAVAFIAGSPEDMDGDTGARLNAYRAGVAMLGLAEDERLIAFGNHVVDGGRLAMQQLLESGASFSAVVASNDESAQGAIQALHAAGRIIPENVAIVGFDDRPESAVLKPALTSVQIPLFRMGYLAVERLLQQIRGQALDDQPIKVPTRLVVRESCGCGHSAVLADVLDLAAMPTEDTAPPSAAQLTQQMTQAVLVEAQGLARDEIEFYCRSLATAFLNSVQTHDPLPFQAELESILGRTTARGDDAHLWQVAISVLRSQARQLPALRQEPEALLDDARVLISAAMRQQHRRQVVDHRWTSNHVGRLTALLLTALDEAQIYESLAHYLAEMGIHTAWLALFEAEDDDPVAWSRIRDVVAPARPVLHSRTRSFPPPEWQGDGRPFSLALLPLSGQQGGAGFMAFDAIHLDLLGAIAQQMSAALNTAKLYREATEGRRLAEEANQLKSRFFSR